MTLDNSSGDNEPIIDVIRFAKLGLDRGINGALKAPSAYFIKSPPEQYPDDDAQRMLEEFIKEH